MTLSERPADFTGFDVVAIVASAGGTRALLDVVSALPRDFAAAVLVVQHRTADFGDMLTTILGHRSLLEVRLMKHGERTRRGTVYVAPADRQALICGPSIIRLGDPGRCTGDGLFTSVATLYGPRAIGVVLTGRLYDGADGARAIKAAGGRVIVQNQATSDYFSMPSAAIATGCVDLVLPLTAMAPALVSLVMWPGAAELLRVPVGNHWRTTPPA